jgi:hypothetical protein
MMQAAHRWLAWLSLALAAALLAAAIGLGLARPGGLPGIPDYGLSAASFQTVMLVYVAAGSVLMHRRPGNPVGWLLAGQALLNIGGEAGGAYAVYALAREDPSLPGAAAGAWAYQWTWLAAILFLWLAVFFFPTGRTPTPRWRPLLIMAWSALVLALLAAALLWPHRAEPALATLDRPVFLGAAQAVGQVAVASVFATAGLAALSVLVRFWRAQGIERQQIKWLFYAAAAMAAGSLVFLATGSTPEIGAPLPGMLLSLLGLAGVPVAIGMAILRYRLYDIDVLINRSLVYATLSLALAGIYFGSVIGLETAWRILTGEQSPLAIIASTLLIAALFSPLRRRIQGAIDRRFYRSKYNAQQILAGFSAAVQHEADLSALRTRLLEVVDETMQPQHVSLWLRQTDGS